MSLLYSKLRLQIPQVSDGKNATITSPRGVNRTVPLEYPLTDVFVAGMDKYTVQAGTGSESFSVGNGKFKKIVTEDASALTVASLPTKIYYLVGESLDLTGIQVNATIIDGNGTSQTRDVTSQCSFSPQNGTVFNTIGEYTITVAYYDAIITFTVKCISRILLKKLPYKLTSGKAVVFNGDIYVLGSAGYSWQMIKFNGQSWEEIGSVPYYPQWYGAIVFQNKIHMFGRELDSGDNESIAKQHYSWNGTSWSQESPLPKGFKSQYNKGYAVLNNELHLITGDSTAGNANTYHYKYDGSSWTTLNRLPSASIRSYSLIVYNNELHCLGIDGNYSPSHYKWNSSDDSWTQVSTPPVNVSGNPIVFNNKIYVPSATSTTQFYSWNGSSWAQETAPKPYETANWGTDYIIWNSGEIDEIVALGSNAVVNNYENGLNVAQWNGSSWALGT